MTGKAEPVIVSAPRFFKAMFPAPHARVAPPENGWTASSPAGTGVESLEDSMGEDSMPLKSSNRRHGYSMRIPEITGPGGQVPRRGSLTLARCSTVASIEQAMVHFSNALAFSNTANQQCGG